MSDRSITLLNNQGLDQHGGGVRILAALAAHLSRRHRVRVVAESAADERPFLQATIPALSPARGPSWRWQPLRKVRHLARVVPPLFAGADPDVVVCLDPHFVGAVARLRPRRCVYVSLSAVPRQEWFAENGLTAVWRAAMYAWIERRMMARADVRVVASDFHAREVRRFELLPRARLHVVPPALPIAGARATATVEPPIVLVVARLVPAKNVECALALAERTRDLPCRFVIVGDGDRRSALAARAAALGDRVTFAGAVDAAPWFRDATVLLHPSRYESFGMVLVEAMQHGVVPLCGAPGPRCRTASGEIVTEGASGSFFDLDDPATGERALRRLLTDLPLRRTLSAGAMARAAELLQRDYAAALARLIEEAS